MLHSSPTRRLLAASLLVAATLLGACSDDESTDGAAQDGDTPSTTAAPSGGGSCASTDVTYEGPGTTDFTAVTTAGVSLSDGAAYTIYLADFEIDPESMSAYSAPEPGEGETLITLAVTVFNAEETPEPLEVGEEIAYTDDFGVLTFRVMSQVGETLNGTNVNASGTVTLTSVGDTFCAEVEYSDDEKSLSGTIEAPVSAV